jgi:multidrug efflux system membrane fusion protein
MITPRSAQPMRALAFAGLLLGTAACRHSAPTSVAPPAAVTVAPAGQAMVTPWSEFTGQLAAVQTVEVRPRVSGYIARVDFHDGAQVRAGDPLFSIDRRPYEALLAGAHAQLARALSAVQLAKAEAARADTLYVARAMAREELETRTNALAQAMADQQAAQASVDTATLDMEWTEVRAPISGRVSRAVVTAGNYVQAGVSLPPLTTIVSQNPIYVYFNADEPSYLALTRHEQAVSVSIALADEFGFPHQARVDFVDNQLDGTTGTIRVRAVLDNARHVFTPGLFARVRLVAGDAREVTLVEDRAVGTDQDKRYVYVVRADDIVEYRPVQLGPLDHGLRVITAGVQPGDRVIVDGLQRVRPGAKVAAQLEVPTADSVGSRPLAAK